MELFYPKQTNTGLYVQLHDKGFPQSDLIRVRDAYLLACKMFNGRYRKTSRAFICHAVGAASSSAHFTEDCDIVIASLLHAAYDSGQFPDGRNGKTSPSHRSWLAKQVGERIEAMLVSYSKSDFEKDAPERLVSDGIEHVDPIVLFMALTHEIDDIADGGLAIAPKYGQSISSRIAACAALARQIDQEQIALTLEAHLIKYNSFDWMQELQSDQLRGYWVVPSIKAYYRLRRRVRRNWAKMH